MDRRNFIKKSIGTGVVLGAAISTGKYKDLFASSENISNSYDLVAIKGREPDVMFDRAIESLGGMKNFVSKNQTVVVKPNMGWDVVTEKAANTNPQLVKRIIEHCFNAGAKDVYVFDHTCDEWTRCYANSGIKKAAEDAGATVIPGNKEGYYQKVDVPGGKVLRSDKIHEKILEADVFINVPILKDHGSARLTIAMKNLMGINWDRGYWHRENLHQCIADLCTEIKPALNVVDAYNVMKRNGPRGRTLEDVERMESQLISTDIVAIDAAATKLFGLEPDAIPYIKIADEMNIGTKSLESLSINRIKL